MNEISLYILNLDSDLSLAHGDSRFIPPASIRKMTDDLCLLPRWYKGEDSLILTDGQALPARKITKIRPWGWSPSLIKRLEAIGIPANLLPDSAQMEAIRRLSHRSLAVRFLPMLAVSQRYCGESMEVCSVEQLRDCLNKPPYRNAVLKAPWSSSGKGILYTSTRGWDDIEAWSRNILKKQGSLTAEPFYEKAQDFAMEFHADGKGGVRFIGYSVFQTNGKGRYSRNLLASNAYMKRLLGAWVPPALLDATRTRLEKLLAACIGKAYEGCLGVDMMVCRFGEPPFFRIHPCVEINLRMNMGIVARKIYDKHLSAGSTGIFLIDRLPPAELLKDHEAKERAFPLARDTEGRITSGYLALTPVDSRTEYRAYLLCTRSTQAEVVPFSSETNTR